MESTEETLGPPNQRAERLAKWVGIAIGGSMMVGVWLGNEQVGLKFATELGVSALFGLLAYWFMLCVGRFIVEGKLYLRTFLSFFLTFSLIAGIGLMAVLAVGSSFVLVGILPMQDGMLKASIFTFAAFTSGIGLIVLFVKLFSIFCQKVSPPFVRLEHPEAELDLPKGKR